MKRQTEKANSATLDGVAMKAIKPVNGNTIDAAADSFAALAEAVREYADARTYLNNAIAAAISQADADVSAIRAVAERLRNEREKRAAATEAYNAIIAEKRAEVAAIYPGLACEIDACVKYATGEVGIREPVEHGPLCKTYVPEITDANAEKVETFAPVRGVTPDTSAIIPPPGAIPGNVARLAESYERFKAAGVALRTALEICGERRAALLAEAEAEAESVKSATAIQRERDAR